ncbi:MAG: DUF3108 domain-containing protein [Bacteroidia bacterium]
MKRLLPYIYFAFAVQLLQGQTACSPNAVVFKPGETMAYEVYYHWGFVWANAGEAVFAVDHDDFQNKRTFHISGTGSTYKNYDWFYKVRDKFESWVDTASLKPFRYVRNSNEGSTHVYNDTYFNYKLGRASCYKLMKGKTIKDTVNINSCTFDVMTMIYYARCIDYSLYKPDTKIPISLYLDGEVYSKLYIRYMGKEKIKTALGEFSCIKFKPLLIPGTIFSGGEEMTVWVTDDERKVPVLIKTPIVVGEVQVKIKAIANSK